MSHISGFRRGGQDFTHTPVRGRRPQNWRSRREADAERRFHEHQREEARTPEEDTGSDD